MHIIRGIFQNQKIKFIIGAIVTLGVIHLVNTSLIILLILLPFWFFLFRPWNTEEIIIFFIASVFFLWQNYAVLKTGGFSFKYKDILLMPYYEPFLWGFYYLTIKRFIGEPPDSHKLHGKAFFGSILTGLCFSLFSKNSTILFISTLISTSILFMMFHERYDFYYALCALILGFIIEVFGVSTGLWSYPEPDFLGIPYWFATMWGSVGLLGRRFLIPFAEWIGGKLHSKIPSQRFP